MSRSESIRVSGWAFLAGAFAFVTILSNSDPIAFPGSMVSALLLATGLLSLRAVYRETVSRSGRNVLLVGAIGATLWDMVLAVLISMSRSGTLHVDPAQGERFWIVGFGAPAVALLFLTLFGLATLGTKPMSPMNWLPILAGIWYPVVYFFLAIYLFTHNGKLPPEYYPVIEIIILMQFLALCMFGASLITNTLQETAPETN
jgi:hypothetical protein